MAFLAAVALPALALPAVVLSALPAQARGSDQQSPRIVGGTMPGYYDYGWLVAVYRGNYQPICTGALISGHAVLTSASCVKGIPASELTVRIGQVDDYAEKEEDEDDRPVTAVTVHPRFDATTRAFDLAVLSVPGTWHAPVTLVSDAERTLWRPGVTARVLGPASGRSPGGPGYWKAAIDVPVLPDATMTASATYGSRFRADSMLGAGVMAGGVGICPTDLGGPLVVSTPQGWRLIGIASWVDGCAQAGKPGVFVRLGADTINGWIRSVTDGTPVDGFGGRAGDVDGDGGDDVVVFTRGVKDDAYVALSYLGALLRDGRIWSDAIAPGSAIPLLGDVDGDGRSDAISFLRGPSGDVFVARSTGLVFGPRQRWHDWFAADGQTPLVGDFNGDRRADIAMVRDYPWGGAKVALSTGTSFGSTMTWEATSPCGDFGCIPAVGDVNADGRDDLVRFTRGSTADVWVSLSTGGGFRPAAKWHDSFAAGSAIPGLGDVNGDGAADLLAFTRGSSADVFVALSTRAVFGPAAKWHDSFAAGAAIPGVGDFNGDGRDDVIAYQGGSSGVVVTGLSSGSTFKPNPLDGQYRMAFDDEIPMGALLW